MTRPLGYAAPLVRALADRRIEAILAPLLSIAAVPDAARRLTDALIGAQALLFTSANGARIFAASSPRRELPVFAVGDASAAAARIAGFRAVTSAGGDVNDLAELVRARLAPQHGALVHAAGSVVAGDLGAALERAGFTYRRAVIYDAVTADTLPPEAVAAMRDGALELALFFSPRTAATFVRLVHAADLARAASAITALGLSERVAAALASLSWQALRVAAQPTQEALIAALDALLAERRQNRA
ncbi:MAG TPA: uroporphyrinogen-III synthase [Stellaceae bacterium]|nr:uroporphyrinogen-III synthase [Stellaceae bacterium]